MKLDSNIRNIIFDLGNVVIDIDPQKTINAFKDMGFDNINEFLGHSRSMGFMAQFQEGKLLEDDFYNMVRQFAGKALTNWQIEQGWNAMLLNYNEKRIERLLELKKNYRTFLFSNTNIVHYRNFAFRVPIVGDIANLFEQTFYSHTLGLAKPHNEAYLQVLKIAGINAHQTLFLDDLPENIDAAKKSGIHARLVNTPNEWLNWL